jgi:hypothetical protein
MRATDGAVAAAPEILSPVSKVIKFANIKPE